MLKKLVFEIQAALMMMFSGMQTRVQTRRAAGFLEYAMLALLALLIFVAIQKFFLPQMEGVFKKIGNKLGATG